jgi:hypothetical protein
MSDYYEKPPMVEVRYLAAKPAAAAKTQRFDHFSTQGIKLPASWKPAAAQAIKESRFEDPTDNKSFFYARLDRIVDYKDKKKFDDATAKVTANLDIKRISGLGEFLGDRLFPNTYKIDNLSVINVHGKKILKIRGKYLQTKQSSITFLFDVGNEHLEELVFQAPTEKFEKNRTLFESSVSDLVWH